jgi:PGF-pre-PGF domain-containing protein
MEAAEFDFTQNATCVTYVMFDARKSMGKVTTVVEMLKEKSQLTPDIPEGEIYSYLNIWAGNDGAAATENIENAVIASR